jgi:peptide/nickel transport system substrate-binding protein
MTDRPAGGLSRRALFAASAMAGLAPGLMTITQARAQGIKPKRGGTLTTILTPEPPLLILGVNNQGPTLLVGGKMYQSLLKFSEKLAPMPELAKSWTLSEDKKTYTFHLQDNVKFHDGQPMTADDVIFSIMKFNFELAPRARAIFQKIKSATAPDPHTVVLTLDSPFEPFLLMFDVTACPIVPKHIYDGTDYRTNPANQKPVGTGPFQFAEWKRGDFIRLKRFDGYWKPGQPYLDEIIYRIIPDSQSRALAVQTGQVMMAQESDIEPFDVPRLKKLPNLNVTTEGWEYFSPLCWVEINNRVKPLDDVRVRQAISLALDRNFITQRLWFGLNKPARGPVSSTTRFFDTALPPLAHDPKKAMALLDAAGLKPNAQGVRFSIKHLVLPYGDVWQRLAEYFRSALKQVGIEVVLESTDAGGWAQRIGAWNYETSINFVYQFGDPTLGVERTYVSTNIQKITFTNTGGYANPKVDALFATARNAADPAARQMAFTAVQALLVKEMPQVWIMEMAFPTISDKTLHNNVELGTGTHACYDDVFIS